MKSKEKTTELGQGYIKQINRELYKRNVELAVRNKTLSILRRLYDITISAVADLKDMAFRLVSAIRQDMNFEMAGIYILKEDSKEFSVLAAVKSERLEKIFEEEKIAHALETLKFTEIVNAHTDKSRITKSFAEIWPDKEFSQAFFNVQKKASVKTVAVYPLLIEEKVLGILIIVLNRTYDSMSIFEKETIDSFINVIAIAVNRAVIYEQLKVLMEKVSKAYRIEKKARKQLQKLDQAKTLFLSIASHQLRTPLTGTKGFLAMILDGDFGDLSVKIRKILSEIYSNNNRLIRLVNTLLNASRIESDHLSLLKAESDVVPMARHIINELQFEAQDRGLTLSLKTSHPKIIANIDADKLEDVLVNLIDNGIKYTPKGSVEVRITDQKDKVRFEVEDTGQGLKESEIKELFNKFVRGDRANMLHTDGSGIGLYIAKQIVKLHNGEIGVMSEGVDKGSVFWFEVPK